MGDSYRPAGGGRDGRGRGGGGRGGRDTHYEPRYNQDHYQNSGYNYDSYPPYERSRGDDYRPQDNNYRPYDDSYRPQQYNSHAPPPPPPSCHPRDSRPPIESYRPQPPLARTEPQRDAHRSDFAFRGAAGDQPQRPEHNFSFTAPSASSHIINAPPRDQWDRDTHRRRDADHGRGRGGPRGRGRGRYRGPYIPPPPAHARDILDATARSTTPEQLLGMDGRGTRFKSVSESSDSGANGTIDLTNDSGDENDAAGSRKRAKTGAVAADSVPKWSNPDPYTVLPPPETLGAPKKDIVQTIRKAKMDTGPKQEANSAVKGNDDFISFNDMDMDQGDDNSSVREISAPPTSFNPINGKQSRYRKPEPHAPASTEYAGPPAAQVSQALPTDEYLAAMNIYPQSSKRKIRDKFDLDDIAEDWQGIEGQNLTPWLAVDHTATAQPGLRLHKEICDFHAFMQPRDYEQRAREDLVLRVQETVRKAKIPHCQDAEVQCFGSFASGLYLPTADMDLVVLSKRYLADGPATIGTDINRIHNLRRHFENSGIARPGTTAAIPRAKVPIVKFIDKQTGIKVDISFENLTGCAALETFEAWRQQYPAMPVMVALVKQMLAMRNLNEVFSGGIGGFTTICLVVHILQIMPELQSSSMDSTANYGEIFMKFLDFFGSKFDITSAGILMYSPFYYDKRLHIIGSANAQRLTIIDPNNNENDIAGGSRHIDSVFKCFGIAHNAMQRLMAAIEQGTRDPSSSILTCVIGGNYHALIEQRERLRRMFGDEGQVNAKAPLSQHARSDSKSSKKANTAAPAANQPNSRRTVQQAAKDWQKKKGSAPEGQSSLSTRTRSKSKDLTHPPPNRNPNAGADGNPTAYKMKKDRKRAKEFREQHPDVRGVPNSLPRKELTKLRNKHKSKQKK